MYEHPDDGYGAPLVGPTGDFFNYQILAKQGFKRSDILVGNTIRCRPRMNQYPTGKLRAAAEAACEHWDDQLIAFDPNWVIYTYHPSAIFKKPQILDFVKLAVKKAFEAAKEGHRPLIVMGNKAKDKVAPNLKGGIKKWQRHFEKRSPFHILNS